VIRPGSPAELAAALKALPKGHRVSFDASVGTVEIIDLSRLCDVVRLDETSLTVTVQAGISAAALEATLAERELTLGPLPPDSRQRTIGALLAAPRASEAAPRFGRFTRRCLALHAVLGDGREVSTRAAPRKATGPDLMHALLGARGSTGLIATATLRLERRSPERAMAFRLPSLAVAADAARAILYAGIRPADLRVCGPELVVILDGPAALAAAEAARTIALAAERGGVAIAAIAAPPPRAHEHAVTLGGIEEGLDEPATHVVGWHAGGAALVDTSRAPTAAEARSASPLRLALKSRLDPERRLPEP
jgi:FAD/FMN-containing dehydrogenase